MSRYIDADAIIKRLKSRFCDKCYNYNGKWCRACLIADIICAIDDEPTADVEEVKRGRWIQDGTGLYARCSVCKERTYLGGRQNYCPNCGTKMERNEEMSNYYTIFINGSLVGHIEADSQEEAVEYVRENWEIEAITDEEYDNKYMDEVEE